LTDEVCDADLEVRVYLAAELSRLLGEPRFRDGVSAALRPDAASQARGDLIVVPRARAISRAAAGGDPPNQR
jgi:hypothetical protein